MQLMASAMASEAVSNEEVCHTQVVEQQGEGHFTTWQRGLAC